MKCAQLRLQERPRTKPETPPVQHKEVKPRRYCQKRMVDPAHEEDPRWIDVFQRYHCKKSFDQDTIDNGNTTIDSQDDICLTVQNLKFQGEVQDIKRPRTSFKYRLLPDSKRHRMFVKQVVEDIEADEDSSSQLSSYYFDDYVKFILTNDRSRPSSSESSLFMQTITNNGKDSKAMQVETKTKEPKKVQKDSDKITKKQEITNDNPKEDNNNIDDAKVAFHKSGKRKSLTISRVPSPETVQVIRVDVVCNYSTSSILSDYYEENKKYNRIDTSKLDKIDDINLKGPHFSNKYLLTNTVKTLDENVSGSKVTLLCKTFKLSDRLKLCADKKNTKMTKDGTKLRK